VNASAKRRTPRYDVPKKAPGSLRLVQEFLNTCDKEHGREWLDTPAALQRWLAEREFGSARVTRADLERARQVRETLREIVRANSGATVSAEATRLLNQVADEAKIVLRFDDDGGVGLDAAARGAAGALGRILLCAYHAMTEGRWQRLKTCPNCRWSFYDYSRNRSAKWCSMSLCGNRSKTRSYYLRRKDPRSPSSV
jgi:predicted RNA-binding Zn ribbon-like protein